MVVGRKAKEVDDGRAEAEECMIWVVAHVVVELGFVCPRVIM